MKSYMYKISLLNTISPPPLLRRQRLRRTPTATPSSLPPTAVSLLPLPSSLSPPRGEVGIDRKGGREGEVGHCSTGSCCSSCKCVRMRAKRVVSSALISLVCRSQREVLHKEMGQPVQTSPVSVTFSGHGKSVTVSKGSLLTNQLFGTCSKCCCKWGVTVNCVTVTGEICISVTLS